MIFFVVYIFLIINYNRRKNELSVFVFFFVWSLLKLILLLSENI